MQDMVAVFTLGKRETTSYRGIDMRWAHQLPGKPAEGHTPPGPFDENNHQLGPGASTQAGQSCAQGLGEAGTGRARDYREQENSHVEWPDLTFVQKILNIRYRRNGKEYVICMPMALEHNIDTYNAITLGRVTLHNTYKKKFICDCGQFPDNSFLCM